MRLPRLFANCALVLLLLGLFYMEYSGRLVDFALGAKGNSLSIAVVADLSGPSAFTGQSHVNGVQLYVDEYNRRGGLDGLRIKVKPFDDRNDQKLSPLVAEEIARDPDIIGVIGHNYSSASMAATDVYKREGVPAITPSSSIPQLTVENPWYFRTVMESNLEAQLSVYYAKAVLKSNRICMIVEDLNYGVALAQAFKENMAKLGMELTCEIPYAVDSATLEQDLRGIVAGLKERRDDPGVIFLASHVGEGVTLVRELKEQGVENIIFAPSSFYNHTFMTAFNELPREQANPGYYTDGVFVTTPLLFDTANREAQEYLVRYENRFNSKPGWHSAFSYDSAKVLLEAAKAAAIDREKDSIKNVRTKVRDALAAIDSYEVAVQGVTGATFFNRDGDIFKPIFVAKFKRNEPISAFTQLQLAPAIGDRKLLDRLAEEGKLVEVNGFYLQETHVVQCGVTINKVEELDAGAVTSLLDFYIWFRHPAEVDPTDIEFVNALDEIDLSRPVSREVENGIVYQRHRVRARFRGNFISMPDTIDRNVLGLSFFHKTLDRHHLVYVTDVLGMGLMKSDSLVRKLNEGQVLPQGRKLGVYSALVYQDIASRATMGQSTYHPGLDGMVEFSRFNYAFVVGEQHVSLRRGLPVDSFWLMVGATILLLLIPFAAKRFGESAAIANLLWLANAVGMAALLLASELVVLRYFSMDNGFDQSLVVKSFDVLWWLVPALLVVQAFESLICRPLERKTGNKIPSIVRLFIKSFIYLVAFFCIIAFVFDQKITSLLATSGVIAMILGFALQVNLSNIFSGLAISLERPFKIGDWIKIEGVEDGKVIEMNWRSVRLLTVCDTIYSVPNSKVADSTVLNYHYPDDYYWLYFPVYVDSSHPPDRVMKVIMDALLETEAVKKHMGPIVRMDYTDKGIAYYPIFLLKGYGSRAADKNSVSKNIWKHLNRAGMTPAVPRQEVHFVQGGVDRLELAQTPAAVIEEHPAFRRFPEEFRQNLAAHAVQRFIRKGTIIYRQGDEAASMYIIAQGIVSIRVESKDGDDHLPMACLTPGGGVKWESAAQEDNRKTKEITRLGAGDCFGETALLTHEPRLADAVALSDCSLLEITREALVPLTGEDGGIDEKMTEYISELEASDRERAAVYAAQGAGQKASEPADHNRLTLKSLKGFVSKKS